MIKKLCLVICLILSVGFFVCADNVSGSKANGINEEIIVLNEEVEPELEGDYIIINPTPVNGETSQEEKQKTQMALILVVCLVAVFGGVFLLFTLSTSIAIAYLKHSKSVEALDKAKKSMIGRMALKAAKASGNAAAATAAKVIEVAPTDLYKIREAEEQAANETEEEYEY